MIVIMASMSTEAQVPEAASPDGTPPAVDLTTAERDELGTRLIEAAAEIFANEGYDRAGVAMIARRAGVTTGAIYSRYASKAELLVEAVRTHCVSPLDSILAPTIAGAAEGETATRLAAAGAHIGTRGLPLGQALLLEAMVAGRRDPELRAVLIERLDERRQMMRTVVDAAQAEGSLDPSIDPHAVVQLMQAIGLGFLLQEAMGLDSPSAQGWAHLIDRIVDGLGNPSTPGTEKGDG
jgi:AcrR family transcriptional regulator